MSTDNNEEYDENFYPLTKMFEDVNDENYLDYIKLANIQYNNLLQNENCSGYYFVNWRVNFANLHEFVLTNLKEGAEVSTFLNYYEQSAPLLYKKLGLEY